MEEADDVDEEISAPPRISSETEVVVQRRKQRRVKRKVPVDTVGNFDIPGVVKLQLSPEMQEYLGCTVGVDVTAENRWKHIRKEAVQIDFNNLQKFSIFAPIKDELAKYKGPEMLIGFIPGDNDDYDEFYLCATNAAEENATEVIRNIKCLQEDMLHNSVYKPIKRWHSHGSERELDYMLVRNNRNLLAVELESSFPIMAAKVEFRLRLAQTVCDGYAELLCGKTDFRNVVRRSIDNWAQVSPAVATKEVQTSYAYPQNVGTQYEMVYGKVDVISDNILDGMKSFNSTRMDNMNDTMTVNSEINLYKNDYLELVRDPTYTTIPKLQNIKEFLYFFDQDLCKGKLINSVSWHPLWTGTVAISYSTHTQTAYTTFKPNFDAVLETMYNITPVLIWSFNDTLKPKLYLESPREINKVSFCPYNENILVGGLENGQVIIWDLQNRLEGVEHEDVLTVAQQGYRMTMKSLMGWMKDTHNLKIVRPTVVSDLELSHRGPITHLRWCSPFREISRCGKLSEIPEESNRRCLQFMTSSRDGSILIWDISPSQTDQGSRKSGRRLRRLKRRPSALTQNISPLRYLNRVLKPVFKILIQAPQTSRLLSISNLTIRNTPASYVEVNPDPNRKCNIIERILYKPTFNRPTHPLTTQMIFGTTEGDIVYATWDGADFNTGEVVNKEVAKIEAIAKYHDGPIISLARSEQFPDLCLTVGGTIFAVWKEALKDRPVFWRKCRNKYTHGVWDIQRPSVFRLSRTDGYVENWHLSMSSYKSQYQIKRSSVALTGIYYHSLPLRESIIGIGDGSGTLRLYMIFSNAAQNTEEDKNSTNMICEREVTRKNKFAQWQKAWNQKYAAVIQARKQQLEEQQKEEEEARKEKERVERNKIEKASKLSKTSGTPLKEETKDYTEMCHQKWMEKEKTRIKGALLKMRALDLTTLEKRQLPALQVTELEERKKRKQRQRLENAEQIYEDTVTALFPSITETKPSSVHSFEHGDSLDVQKGYFNMYKDIETASEGCVSQNSYRHRFDWHKLISQGKDRRKILDGYYNRESHKSRIINEKLKPKFDQAIVSQQKPDDDDLSSEDVDSKSILSRDL